MQGRMTSCVAPSNAYYQEMQPPWQINHKKNTTIKTMTCTAVRVPDGRQIWRRQAYSQAAATQRDGRCHEPLRNRPLNGIRRKIAHLAMPLYRADP